MTATATLEAPTQTSGGLPLSMASTAIFVRISKDSERDGLGVGRQEHACRDYVVKRDLPPVYDVYVEDHVSAYRRGVTRRDYGRLLADIQAGRISHVVTWMTDRMHRNVGDLLAYIDVVKPDPRKPTLKSVTHSVFGGLLDLSNPTGIATAITVTAWAWHESAIKSARQQAKHAELARDGKFRGGKRRFGFTPTMDDLVPSEAAIISDLAQRIIRGESLASLAKELNATGVATATGSTWTGGNLGTLFRKGGHLAGLCRNGDGFTQATWQPIISRQTWETVRAILTDPARRVSKTTARRYLLSGLATCGHPGCDSVVRGRPATKARKDGSKPLAYICAASQHVYLPLEWVDARVADLVAGYMMAKRVDLSSPIAGSGLADIESQEAHWEAQRKVAVRMHMAGDYSDGDLKEAVAFIKAQQADLGRQRQAVAQPPAVLAELATADTFERARAMFVAFPLDRQREVVRTLGSLVLCKPHLRGRPGPECIQMTWHADA